MEHEYRTWIEIDTSVIKKNISTLKATLAPHVRFCAVVKSNAYGHYLERFAKEAVVAGADMLAVDSFVEAKALRDDGVVTPILVLGYTLPKYYKEAALQKVALTVSSVDHLLNIEKSDVKNLRVHIKLDTGMHRQGFQVDDLRRCVSQIKALHDENVLVVEGVYTHLASAKAREYSASVEMQKSRFEKMLAVICDAGIDSFITHAAASGGALMYPDMHYDMVRVGMACYGCWPAEEVRILKSKALELTPSLSWKSIISEVKNVAEGERVGYDGTHILSRDSRIAVVPIGYWHGYDRSLSNNAEVLVQGRRVPVIGRVSMDMIVIDVTDVLSATADDVVTLIGRDGDEKITAEELARSSDTTAYETLTRINPLIERKYS